MRKTKLSGCMMDEASLTPHILGPHPGLSILRIWQGIVEVVLRIVFALCGICTVALSATVVSDVHNSSLTINNSLDRDSVTAGVCVACFVGAALLVEASILVLRFLNIGLINFHMKKFFFVDIVISAVLVVVCVIAGLAQAVYAGRWRTAPSSCYTSEMLCRDHNWGNLTAAAAVGCLLCAILAGVLAVWSFLFIIKRWYYKLLQYMSLP